MTAPTHTPAAQPAGEMDDAALVKAMARAMSPAAWSENASDNDVHIILLRNSARRKALTALAIARPVLQDQARRKALDEAAATARGFTGAGILTEHGFLMGPNAPSAIAAAILALKDKPNG